jgi:hypothetical protein
VFGFLYDQPVQVTLQVYFHGGQYAGEPAAGISGQIVCERPFGQAEFYGFTPVVWGDNPIGFLVDGQDLSAGGFEVAYQSATAGTVVSDNFSPSTLSLSGGGWIQTSDFSNGGSAFTSSTAFPGGDDANYVIVQSVVYDPWRLDNAFEPFVSGLVVAFMLDVFFVAISHFFWASSAPKAMIQ